MGCIPSVGGRSGGVFRCGTQLSVPSDLIIFDLLLEEETERAIEREREREKERERKARSV